MQEVEVCSYTRPDIDHEVAAEHQQWMLSVAIAIGLLGRLPCYWHVARLSSSFIID